MISSSGVNVVLGIVEFFPATRKSLVIMIFNFWIRERCSVENLENQELQFLDPRFSPSFVRTGTDTFKRKRKIKKKEKSDLIIIIIWFPTVYASTLRASRCSYETGERRSRHKIYEDNIKIFKGYMDCQ